MRASYAGSDELAAQIRQGVRPDVFAAANAQLPDALYREGLVERPVVFAANRLVVAVPPGSRVRSIEDLARPGTKVAVGSPSVPVGDYTRAVLARLDGDTGAAVLRNVRTEEPNAGGVAAKVVHGAVDAGFVYRTDVRAADGKLRIVELPRAVQPAVAYSIAVVEGARNPDAARAYVDGLLSADGARILSDAGFQRPR